MEEILSLRDASLKTTVPELKKLLQERKETVVQVRNKYEQSNAEHDAKINELRLKLASLKAELRMKTETTEQKNHKLLSEVETLKGLKAEKLKLFQDVARLEQESRVLRTIKPSKKDEELLDLGKEKYKLYKRLTGIHWDIPAIESGNQGVKGFVSNNLDYVHHFCYKMETSKQLTDLLWEEIHKSTVKTD